MEQTKFVLDAVMAIASGFAQKGVMITLDKAKEFIEEILKLRPSSLFAAVNYLPGTRKKKGML